MRMFRLTPRTSVAGGLILLALAIGIDARVRTRAQPAAPQFGPARAVFVPIPPIVPPVDAGQAAARGAPAGRIPPALGAVSPLPAPTIQGVAEGFSQEVTIDGRAFAAAIEAACGDLVADGYEIVSVTPILRGYGRASERQGAATYVNLAGVPTVAGGYGTGWGFGFPVTDGVVIVAVRK